MNNQNKKVTPMSSVHIGIEINSIRDRYWLIPNFIGKNTIIICKISPEEEIQVQPSSHITSAKQRSSFLA